MGTFFTVIRSAFFRQLACRIYGSRAHRLERLTPPAAQEPERYQAPALPLPPSAERAYRALALRVDGLAALDTVRYMDS